MQHPDVSDTWIDWVAANDDASDGDKLIALRTIIFNTALIWRGSGDITAEWANKKLYALGIAERIEVDHSYAFEAPVSAFMDLRVFASNRTEALEKVTALLRVDGGGMVKRIAAAGDPKFVDGPEDLPKDASPDAPTTVDATLMKLREIIMLGNIAGPRFNCENGVNRVLASYGLDPIPPRKVFTVDVPVEGFMRTNVEAYDEESAKRVAGWRWDNGRSGYVPEHMTDTNTPVVAAPN